MEKNDIKAYIKTSVLLNLPKLLQTDVYTSILTRSVEKGVWFKGREFRAQFAPTGQLNARLGVCRRQTSLLGKCHSRAGAAGPPRCQHTPVHTLSERGCETCQQSLPPPPPIYYPQRFPNSSIAGLCVKHQSASVFTTFTNNKIPPALSAPRKSAAMMQSSIFILFFLIPFRNTNACLPLLLPVPNRDAL